jgi:hypothetical protein
MHPPRPDLDDELEHPEPMRIVFALTALLLGLLAALHG